MKYNKNTLIKFRRDLHQIPELDFDLPKTTSYIKNYLKDLPFVITDIGKAGFTAFYDAGKKHTVAFRTDMDALPIQEKTNLDFHSVHPGRMHACGHDGHMSIMMGFASVIPQLSATLLNSNVLLIFQAAEETTGGAKEICDSRILQKYDTTKLFGLHLWPDFPKHTVICRKNEFMAGTKVLWLNIFGTSSHIAKSEEGVDALDIGTKIIQDIYRMEREEIPDNVKRILKFGEFKSGTGVNILSGKTEIGGTTRYFDDEVLENILLRIREIISEYEKMFRCKIDFKTSEGYPPVINPPHLVNEIESVVDALPKKDGRRFLSLDDPLLTSEDFSYYQRTVPGSFFFLGTGTNKPLHNEYYDIDEDVLPTGVEIFKALLLNQ